MSRAVVVTTVALALLTTAFVPSSAAAMDLEAGARLGGGWNSLVSPTDPAGTDTLLQGSSFGGMAFLIGPTATLNLTEFEGAKLNLTADLLYGFHRASGWERHMDGDTEVARIDVYLSTHVLRLPLMVQVASSDDTVSPTLGLGIEPIFGIMSGATVEQTGINQPVQALDTTPTTSVAGLVAFGLDWNQGDFIVPIDLRLAWNPFVGSSTVDRFDGYEDRQNPGAYRVAFNWQFMATAGIRWGL